MDLEVMSIKSGRRGNLRRFWAGLKRQQRDGEDRASLLDSIWWEKQRLQREAL
jgi:hypothetical protein